jgi:mannosyltransferase OCH1-like enzyme
MNINYIWIDFKNEMNKNPEIPSKYMDRIKKCAEINSDFNFKIWNGFECRQLIKDNYPQYLNMYDNFKNPIIRCDIARLFILYHYGGIYMDMDRICVKSLSKLIEKYKYYDVLLCKPEKELYLNNDFIFSRNAKSDFIFYCIKSLKTYNLPSFLNSIEVNLTAGPLFLTYCYYTYKGTEKIKYTTDVSVCNMCNCSLKITEKYVYEDFSEHSWINKYDKFYLFIICNWKIIVIILLLIILLYKRFR